MERKVYTGKNVMASGPYSHAVDSGEYIFFSGQTAKNALNQEVGESITEQTRMCFKNLAAVMREAQVAFDNVVKVNVYLTGMKHFEEMNAVYQEVFQDPYPARTCVAVLELPLGADVEIECIVKKPAQG
ncbi:RidA family protein [Enterococcus saccharolyticus]|uniref:RidA family protein n=1 Tax=Enterococcus TaxID=1350 RepID=UPI001E60B340|nr:RidA family protein [Enterococcus saccharolyticus]MCD5000974.1 RidA family protein [Enterococcus saccharolyticus]